MGGDSKIVISGYGRSGTSLLVYLFTLLGYETGFSVRQCEKHLVRPCHAGLEWSIDFLRVSNHMQNTIPEDPEQFHPHGREVIKNPNYCHQLREYCKEEEGRGNIGHLIIPLRGSLEAAMSRQRLGTGPGGWWIARNPAVPHGGLDPALHAGESRNAPYHDHTVETQVRINNEALGELMDTVVQYDIPHTLLKFPEFVEDVRGTYFKLKPLLKDKDIEYKTFKEAFLTAVDKGKIYAEN